MGNDPTNATDPAGLQKVTSFDSFLDKAGGLRAAQRAGRLTPAFGPYWDVYRVKRPDVGPDTKLSFLLGPTYMGTWTQNGRDLAGVVMSIGAEVDSAVFVKLKIMPLHRFFSKLPGGINISADPSTDFWEGISGWGNQQSEFCGWMVDAINDEVSVWITRKWNGREGDPSRLGTAEGYARIYDSPALLASDRNLGQEFYTCAIGEDAQGRQFFLGSLHWGFYVDAQGVLTLDPKTPRISADPPPPFEAAVNRWNDLCRKDDVYDPITTIYSTYPRFPGLRGRMKQPGG
jgi:hypothetical protein